MFYYSGMKGHTKEPCQLREKGQKSLYTEGQSGSLHFGLVTARQVRLESLDPTCASPETELVFEAGSTRQSPTS